MSTKNKLSIAIVFVAFSTWFYFTPYLAVSAMKSAAEAKDAAKLSDYVNFPAVRDSLRASFNAKLAAEVPKGSDNNPFSALGAAMAAAFINPMIDALVTPESLAMMMKGEKPKPANNSAQSSSPESEVVASESSESNDDTSMSYENFDRFVVTVKKKDSAEEPFGLVFNRDGIFSWKLSALRLPI
jgi:hypothetical protein